jgi:hypothetical protein
MPARPRLAKPHRRHADGPRPIRGGLPAGNFRVFRCKCNNLFAKIVNALIAHEATFFTVMKKQCLSRFLITAVFPLLMAAAITGCTSVSRIAGEGTHKAWQMDTPVKTISNSKARLGVIEFDDQGQLWRDKKSNHSQLGAVLDDLKAQAAKRPVFLLLYVHGWNNNANPDKQQNLQKFERSLRAMEQSFAGTPVQTYGVFVSWRGGTLPFTFPLDYYNREAAAVRVGRVEATAAIQAICDSVRSNDDSRVVAVGHSFGGVILMRAIAQPMASRIAESAIRKKPIAPMADTLLLVNPADNAILARQMITVMQDFKVSAKKNGVEVPMLVSLTSKGDIGTGRIYTTAQFIARYGLSGVMTSHSGLTQDRSQEKATTTSVGHYKPVHSHEIKDDEDGHEHIPPSITLPKSPLERLTALINANTKPRDERYPHELVLWLDPEQRKGKPGSDQLKAFSLQRMSSPLNGDSPFWILQMPDFIVDGHSDIWNPNITGVITALHYASIIEKQASSPRRVEQRIKKPEIRIPGRLQIQAQMPE